MVFEIKNIFGLEGPGTELVKALRSATGVLYEPQRIKRKLAAEAKGIVEADKILALGEIENKEIVERAANRLIEKTINQQENIEAVIEEAIPLLDDDAKPEEIDKDWLNRFVNGAEQVSDDEARRMWAKILSGEANNPGKYSIRTVNTLTNIGKKEANQIRLLANNSINYGKTPSLIITNDTLTSTCASNPLNFEELNDLMSLGLLSLNNNTGYRVSEKLPKGIKSYVFHSDETAIYSYIPADRGHLATEFDFSISIGCAALTTLGRELISFVDEPDNSKLLEWLCAENELGWQLVKEEK